MNAKELMEQMTTEDLTLANQRLMRKRDELKSLLSSGQITARQFQEDKQVIKNAQRLIGGILDERDILLRQALEAAHAADPRTQYLGPKGIGSKEVFGSG